MSSSECFARADQQFALCRAFRKEAYRHAAHFSATRILARRAAYNLADGGEDGMRMMNEFMERTRQSSKTSWRCHFAADGHFIKGIGNTVLGHVQKLARH